MVDLDFAWWSLRFVGAVEHLRNELARNDQELSKTLVTSWEELAATVIVIDQELEVSLAERWSEDTDGGGPLDGAP